MGAVAIAIALPLLLPLLLPVLLPLADSALLTQKPQALHLHR